MKNEYERLEDDLTNLAEGIKKLNYKASIQFITKINEKIDCQIKKEKESKKLLCVALNSAKIISDSILDRLKLLASRSSFTENRIIYLPPEFTKHLGVEIKTNQLNINSLREIFQTNDSERKTSLLEEKGGDEKLFEYLDNLEKALYDASLGAHIQGYCGQYKLSEIRNIIQENRSGLSAQKNPDSQESVFDDLLESLITIRFCASNLSGEAIKIKDSNMNIRASAHEALNLFLDSMNSLITRLKNDKKVQGVKKPVENKDGKNGRYAVMKSANRRATR